ncbi:MAG TPA: tRNA adenosine deaminase-associated protein [Mycobacteriales bacterium]|jgi:putative tRNA adenosine deaminase-associated protein|nr:tRNA adenosine deaminase-associated protein [Mycobacteriales bacterium]
MGDDFAVVVTREAGVWEATLLPEKYIADLDQLLRALRQQISEGGVIALVNVADEFFVAVRIMGDEIRVLLSDVTAAVAWDLAAQVLELLDEEPPGDDDLDEVWPVGDLSIFVDLGLDEMELGAVLSNLDAYADEMLLTVARRAGFGEAYERVVETSAH